MANNLGLTEVTLEQASDSTHAVNTRGAWNSMDVIRITDHANNTSAEEDDAELMAIFERKGRGFPWEARGTKLEQVIFKQESSLQTVPDNVSTLYPNFDYTEFE